MAECRSARPSPRDRQVPPFEHPPRRSGCLAPGYHLTVFLALFLVLVVLFVVLPVIGMPAWAIISTIIVGLVIGALGRLVVPGRQRVNVAVVFLAGLIGSIVGGFLGSHVLGLGWIGTTLVEIGVAAAVIAFIASPRSRRLVRGR